MSEVYNTLNLRKELQKASSCSINLINTKSYLSWIVRWLSDNCIPQSRREVLWVSPPAPERSLCDPWTQRHDPRPWAKREVPPQRVTVPHEGASSTDSRSVRTIRSRLASTGQPDRSLVGPERRVCYAPTRPPRITNVPRVRKYCRYPLCCWVAYTVRNARSDMAPP